MTLARAALATGALLACSAAQSADITVYKQPNFTGERLPVQQETRNLAAMNFHDQISSIVVHSGAWEVCTQPNFRGDCVILVAGRYPALDTRLNHRIESIREAPGYTTVADGVPAVEIFPGTGFMGRARAIRNDTHALVETGLEASAASAVVRDGTWQLCTEPGYQGVCRVFAPGRYSDLEGIRSVVSARRLGAP